jgi:hypothetical protein
MRAITVETARKSIKEVGVPAFAAEMGISHEDAEYVAKYVDNTNVTDDSLVLLSEAVIDGVKFGAGNRKLCTA